MMEKTARYMIKNSEVVDESVFSFVILSSIVSNITSLQRILPHDNKKEIKQLKN